MWTAEATLDIDAPPDRVWALLADVPGWPRWNAAMPLQPGRVRRRSH